MTHFHQLKPALILLALLIVLTAVPMGAGGENFSSLQKKMQSKYPREAYILGLGMTENRGSEDDILKAKIKAMSDLASQVKCSVKSEMVDRLTQNNKELQEYVSAQSKLISELEIEGVEYQAEKDNKFVYAWAILPKSQAAGIYRQKLSQLVGEISSSIARIKQNLDTDDKNKLLKDLLATASLFDRWEESALILLVLSDGKSQVAGPGITRAEVEDRIYRVTTTRFQNLDEAVNGFCFQLSRQLKGASRLTVFPFDYQDTDFGSEFSDLLRQKIEAGLSRFMNFKPVPRDQAEQEKLKPGAGSFVYGNYWVKGGEIKLIATLYDAEKGVTFGSAETRFPEKFLQEAGIQYQPQNFVQAMSEKKYFSANEVIYGDLKIEFWTNKGDDRLFFKEGETMKLYVRSNLPAYLQFVYHLAGGERTPLIDNYYLDQSKVNKVVEFPSEFECAAPFGVEKLQIFASTDPLPKIKTKKAEIGGVEYDILEEGLPEFLAGTRGFVKKNVSKSAERVITITTVKK